MGLGVDPLSLGHAERRPLQSVERRCHADTVQRLSAPYDLCAPRPAVGAWSAQITSGLALLPEVGDDRPVVLFSVAWAERDPGLDLADVEPEEDPGDGDQGQPSTG